MSTVLNCGTYLIENKEVNFIKKYNNSVLENKYPIAVLLTISSIMIQNYEGKVLSKKVYYQRAINNLVYLQVQIY